MSLRWIRLSFPLSLKFIQQWTDGQQPVKANRDQLKYQQLRGYSELWLQWKVLWEGCSIALRECSESPFLLLAWLLRWSGIKYDTSSTSCDSELEGKSLPARGAPHRQDMQSLNPRL